MLFRSGDDGNGGTVTAANDKTHLFTNQASAITVLIDSVGDISGTSTTPASLKTTATTAVAALNAARDAEAATSFAGSTYSALSATDKATVDANATVAASIATAKTATQAAIAGTSSGVSGAMLNVNITTPTLRVQTGAIYVANSNAAATDQGFDADGNAIAATANDTDGTLVSNKIRILDGMGLTMGNSTTNIQLGSEAQGAMIAMNTTMTGGLTIDKLSLRDSGQAVALTQLGDTVTSGGSLYVGQMKITGNGSSDLALNVNVDVGSKSTNTFEALTAGGAGGAQQAAFKNQAAINNGYASYAIAPAPVKTAIDNAYSTQLLPAQSTLQNGYNGLVINLVSVGGANGMDIALNDLRLGDSTAAYLGDIQLIGLNVNGTKLVITGH